MLAPHPYCSLMSERALFAFASSSCCNVCRQQSSVFGTPRYREPPVRSPRSQSPRQYGSLRLGVPKSAAAAPPRPQSMAQLNQTIYTDAQGRPRAAESTQEQQISSVIGGSPTKAQLEANTTPRHYRANSILKVEFNNLPSDADTYRLHQCLSALPYDQGVTCDLGKVHVKYDALLGTATGPGWAQFRNVPDADRVMETLCGTHDTGILKGVRTKVVYDDRKDARGQSRGGQTRFVKRQSLAVRV